MSHSWKNKKEVSLLNEIKSSRLAFVVVILTQTGEKVKGTALSHGKVSLYISFSIFSVKIICYSDCSVVHNMLLPRDVNCNHILADAEKKRKHTKEKERQK